MIPISFNQLLAKNLFNMPLPENDLDGCCRECGGPIAKGTGLRVDVENEKEYLSGWVDEGIIPFNESAMVCSQCNEIAKGSTTRSTTIPPMGMVMLVTPDEVFPNADKLRPIWTSKGIKKEQVYDPGLSMMEFLQRLPEIPTPFGVVIGGGGKNDKHFFRSVPLNWTIGDSITGLLMADYKFVSFRWQLLLDTCQKGISEGVLDLPKGSRGDAYTKIALDNGLTGTESKLFADTMMGLVK